MRGPAALAWVLASACSYVSLETRWAPDDALQYDPAQYPDDAAVALYVEDGRLIRYRYADPSYTQVYVHRVYAIQHERAFDLAEVRIPLWGKSKLISLKARHRRPDGSVRELLPHEVVVDESDSTDGKATNARLFRLPNVEVGSVLEWVYVVELPYLDTDDESESFGEYPVRRFEGWIEASKEIIVEARFYNTGVKTSAGEGRDARFRRIAATVRDIAPRPGREDYAADWTFSQPRWAYRMLRWNDRGHAIPVLQTWTDVLSRWGQRAWSTDRGALLAGYDLELDVKGCGDAACRVQRAVAWMKEATAYTGVGSFGRMRAANDIVRSGEASSFERALLVRRLLEDAGVTASLATYTARYSAHTDTSFPTLQRFNRMLVYVPKQSGLEQEMWVDPSCDSCGPGEVSDEAVGVTAYVFRARLLPVGEFYDSESRVVTAKGSAPPSRKVAYLARVAASGDVELEVQVTRSGRWAASRCAEAREFGRGARWNEALGEVRAIAPTARLRSAPQPECRPGQGWAFDRLEVLLPGHAVADGDRLYVPLTLLEPFWAGTFAEDKRYQPIAVEGGEARTELTVQLEAPPGWVLSSGPKSEAASAPGMRAAFEVAATPAGARARLSLDVQAGLHAPTDYPAYRALGEFVRGARTRVLELRRAR